MTDGELDELNLRVEVLEQMMGEDGPEGSLPERIAKLENRVMCLELKVETLRNARDYDSDMLT